MDSGGQLGFSENCSASGGVAVATLREDGQFAAAQMSSGAVGKCESPIYTYQQKSVMLNLI